MRELLFRWTHYPSFIHEYSSCRMYFCRKVITPRVFKHHVYFPIRWWKIDVNRVVSDSKALPYIRKALSYSRRKH